MIEQGFFWSQMCRNLFEGSCKFSSLELKVWKLNVYPVSVI